MFEIREVSNVEATGKYMTLASFGTAAVICIKLVPAVWFAC